MTRIPTVLQQHGERLGRGLSFQLPASSAAAGEARRTLTSASGMLPIRLLHEALLLVTELVNNAVIHGSRCPADVVEVGVRGSYSEIRVEVRDRGAGFEWQGPPEDPARTSGYGLVLVDAVADRWGIDRSTGRTCVWFELTQAAV